MYYLQYIYESRGGGVKSAEFIINAVDADEARSKFWASEKSNFLDQCVGHIVMLEKFINTDDVIRIK